MKVDSTRSHDFEYCSLSLSGSEAQAILDLPSKGGKVGFVEIRQIKEDYIGLDNWYRYARDNKKPSVLKAGTTYLAKFKSAIIKAIANATTDDSKEGSSVMNFKSEDGYPEFLNELTISVKLKRGEKIRIC